MKNRVTLNRGVSFFWDIWILAITISQVLKNAITILLIGNLPLQLLIQHIHALIYVSREAGPTGRRRILV